MDPWNYLQKLAQRVRILEVRNPLENAAVDRGGLYIRSNEGLVVEGSAKVSGWLIVTGTLKGTGTFDWSGDMNISGSQHVTGPTVFDGSVQINGPVTVAGTFDVTGAWKLIGNGQITGNTTITGNVDVNSPGRIRITGGSSPATLENGRLSFGTGGQVVADTGIGGVKMQAADAVVNVGAVASMRKGSASIIVGAGGVTINPSGDGPIDFLGTVYFDRSTIPTVGGTGLPVNVLLIGASGELRRTDGT